MIKENKGFTLIELLIVVSIIGILAAIAIPGYIGMLDRSRRGAVTRACASSVPELQGWINAVKKGGTGQGAIIEVDTNGDGTIDALDDDNTTLSTNGVVSQYIATTQARNQISPWNAGTDLWVIGVNVADQAACDAHAATNNPGQITVCYLPNENQTIQYIYLAAVDNDGGLFYSHAISAD